MILHTVNKGPGSELLQSCLRHAGKNDTIVFLEDGVYCAMDNSLSQSLPDSTANDYQLYVLAPDVSARGLTSRIPDKVTSIHYSDLVELCTAAQKIINWC